MSFTTCNANPQHNFFLDRTCPEYFDRMDVFTLPGFSGEAAIFLHDYFGKICVYTGSAVHIYAADLSSAKLIGALPPGDTVLFTDTGAWATTEGPVRKFSRDFVPVLEEYVVPHGGPWTNALGLFTRDMDLTLAYAFCGGPRQWAPALQLNAGKLMGGPNGDRLDVPLKTSRPGGVESMVQLGDRLYAAGEKGLALYSHAGVFLKETPLPQGIVHLSACPVRLVVGGFCLDDGRWHYREFDADGVEVFSYALSGATVAGYAVFDPDGSRYLMSDKRLIKISLDGNRVWSKSLAVNPKEIPRFLVYQEGRCAYVENGSLVLLDPEGVPLHSLYLGGAKIVSPPFLDETGTFWLGLAKQSAKIMKVGFKT